MFASNQWIDQAREREDQQCNNDILVHAAWGLKKTKSPYGFWSWEDSIGDQIDYLAIVITTRSEQLL